MLGIPHISLNTNARESKIIVLPHMVCLLWRRLGSDLFNPVLLFDLFELFAHDDILRSELMVIGEQVRNVCDAHVLGLLAEPCRLHLN